MLTTEQVTKPYGLEDAAEWLGDDFMDWLEFDSGLRDYQQAATVAALLYHEWQADPCCIVAATGSGKSHIIAALAKYYGTALVLQPTADLVVQNCAKADAIGLHTSIFSAGAGSKDLSGDVVFATPLTLANLDDMPHVRCIIIDEAHRAPGGCFELAKSLQRVNPKAVVICLTATPIRLGEGFLYRRRPDGTTWPEEQCRNPFCDQCVYDIDAPALIERGYLVPVTIGKPAISYDTSSLQLQRGKYTAESLEKTADKITTQKIVSELVTVIQHRKESSTGTAMVFCSTVQHAQLTTRLLQLAGLRVQCITADTARTLRTRWLDWLRAGELDAIVNVSVLTTGVDVPRVDVIAILRPTESVSLWWQIVGRGMRLCPGKNDVLLLEYTNNLDFFPEGDIWTPSYFSVAEKNDGEYLQCTCPDCGHDNLYRAHPNKEGLPVDKQGYFLDLAGARLIYEGQPMPAHYGRRCQGIAEVDGKRCDFMYVGKTCKHCGCDNDIAARKCRGCGAPLISWDKKLKEMAVPPAVWKLKTGGFVALYEDHEIVYGDNWMRIDFYVVGRKTPLGWFTNGTTLQLIDDGRKPYAITWSRRPGSKYPDARPLWSKSEFERLIRKLGE